MSYIRVNFSEIQASNAILHTIILKVQQVGIDHARVERALEEDIKNRMGIADSFRSIQRRIDCVEEQLKRLQTVVDSGCEQYRRSEARIMGQAPSRD